MIDRIIAFENGELDEEETTKLFQDLVDSGVINQLQGFYGRMAQSLIEAGAVTFPEAHQ